MKKEVHLTILYDYYGNLFNEKQKEYFENYYFNNLSLAEIAENLKVSRNAVHKQIKLMEDKLTEYEKILKLYEKDTKIKEIMNKVQDETIIKDLEKLLNN